jgi:hypothetical protein
VLALRDGATATASSFSFSFSIFKSAYKLNQSLVIHLPRLLLLLLHLSLLLILIGVLLTDVEQFEVLLELVDVGLGERR